MEGRPSYVDNMETAEMRWSHAPVRSIVKVEARGGLNYDGATHRGLVCTFQWRDHKSARAIDLSLELPMLVDDRLRAPKITAEFGPARLPADHRREETTLPDVVWRGERWVRRKASWVCGTAKRRPRPTGQYLGIGCGKRPLVFSAAPTKNRD